MLIAERTGQEFLALWEVPEPTVVVGRSAMIGLEANADTCEAEQIPILRRQSGGGAVVLAAGCLNYSVILNLDKRPPLRDVQHSYGIILGSILSAAGLPGARQTGNDLTIGGRKFGGCSQKRTRSAVLHHGTILYDFDPALAERYLPEPRRRPEYRGSRTHRDFLTNIRLSDAFAERLAAQYPSEMVLAA